MKIELEKVSNGWVITTLRSVLRQHFADTLPYYEDESVRVIARNVPDCLAELSKIMEKA